MPHNPLAEQLKLASSHGPEPTARTMQLLRQYDLASNVRDVQKDSRGVLAKLQAVVDRQPSAERLYCVAEMNYLVAKQVEARDEASALDHYGAAVAHAYLYLFDERFSSVRNPYDPEFRGACDVYNGALESAMRIVRKRGGLLPGKTQPIDAETQRWDVKVVVVGGRWRPEDFDRFEFVSDYQVRGLANQYHSYGLGVPLIAVRISHASDSPGEQFLPPELSFPVTALLRVLPDHAATGPKNTHQCVLELYDPLESSDIMLGRRRVPLETDLSTPLAFFLNDPRLESMATDGLLHPDQSQKTRGLRMLEPYAPGKIPVLMVHGLWSSPLTWMEMFNDLRSNKEIRDHYQFWFYQYPTGQPFWVSAAQLREDLARARNVLDPRHSEPALDQMVLVGHSMGGLLSKLQTVDSGEAYWRTVSEHPLEELSLPAEAKMELAKEFYFHPNTSVRRIITIATPHRGSDFANDTTRWLAQRLITLPKQVVRDEQQLYRDNPGKIRSPSPIQVVTSIDSLAPDVPIFPVLLQTPRPVWVKHHNIVGEISKQNLLGKIARNSDGAVSVESAHLDGVDSEIVVNADHLTVHRHPRSVLEVQRILLLHLDELRNFPGSPQGRVQTVAAPAPAGMPRR